MAIRKVSEGIGNWNNRIPFPKDRYTLRVVEEKHEPNSNGNPMITRTFEIVAPELAQVGETKVNVSGLKVTTYTVTKVSDGNGGWDAEKSDAAFARLRDDLLLFDPTLTEIDDENPPLIAKGKFVDAIVYGKQNTSFKTPTPEQLAKGQKIGDPIKDANGKDIVTYQLAIEGRINAVVADPSGGMKPF